MTPAEMAARAQRLANVWHSERSGFLAEHEPGRAIPMLAYDVINLAAQVATVTAERDRLARILAVERGDASAAPEGWSTGRVSGWGSSRGAVRRFRAGHYAFDIIDGARGVAPTALEGMEQVDAAKAAKRGEP